MEGSFCPQKVIHRDLDLSKHVGIDEIQAASSVHEHLLGGKTSYLSLEDQSVMSWARDLWWVI
jgi:hypothetical protein